MKRVQLFGFFLCLPALFFIFLFCLYPIVDSFWMSLHESRLTLPHLGSSFVGLKNYESILGDSTFQGSILTTFLFVAASIVLELFLGLIMALAMNEAFRARGIYRAIMLIPWALPTVVVAQLWRHGLNSQFGWVNRMFFGTDINHYAAFLAEPGSALLSIILVDVWKTSAFAALLILAGLQMIPNDLYAAARVDGAGLWRRFWHITWPLVRPALLIALLFRTMDAFRIFDLVYVMTQGGPADSTNVLQFMGYKRLFAEGNVGEGAAIAVFIFGVSFIVSLVYIRFVGKSVLVARRS